MVKNSEPSSTELLKEILSLARINEVLLRQPNKELQGNIEELSNQFLELDDKVDRIPSQSIVSIPDEVLVELTHLTKTKLDSYAGIQMILALTKDSLPWVV